MKNKEKKSEMLEQPPLFHVQVLFFIVNEMNSDRLEAFVLTPRNFLESHVSSRNPEWFNGAFYIVFKLFLLQKIIIVAIFMTRNYKISFMISIRQTRVVLKMLDGEKLKRRVNSFCTMI